MEKFEDLFNDKEPDWEVKDNPNYVKARKPGWCRNKPMYQCLSKSCPFFGYANAERKVYKKTDELYK